MFVFQCLGGRLQMSPRLGVPSLHLQCQFQIELMETIRLCSTIACRAQLSGTVPRRQVVNRQPANSSSRQRTAGFPLDLSTRPLNPSVRTLDLALRGPDDVGTGMWELRARPCHVTTMRRTIQRAGQHGRKIRRERLWAPSHGRPLRMATCGGSSPTPVRLQAPRKPYEYNSVWICGSRRLAAWKKLGRPVWSSPSTLHRPSMLPCNEWPGAVTGELPGLDTSGMRTCLCRRLGERARVPQAHGASTQKPSAATRRPPGRRRAPPSRVPLHHRPAVVTFPRADCPSASSPASFPAARAVRGHSDRQELGASAATTRTGRGFHPRHLSQGRPPPPCFTSSIQGCVAMIPDDVQLCPGAASLG